MFVAEQIVRDEVVEEGVQDEQPSNGKEIDVMGAGIYNVGERRL